MKNKEIVELLKRFRVETVEHWDGKFINGLCIVLSALHKLSTCEYLQIRYLLKVERLKMRKRTCAYLWPAGQLEPRLKWIDSTIKEYEFKAMMDRVMDTITFNTCNDEQ